jgi:hypothetical protein
VTRNPLGYPDACIPLPEKADEVQLSEICNQHTDRLFAWLEQIQKEGPSLTKTRYDGTMGSA